MKISTKISQKYKLKFLVLNLFLLIFSILYNYLYNKTKYKYNNQIKVDTGLGHSQGYHPKILSFEKLWNGYKYWMAFTPYPHANDKLENPTINVSNDLINWISPKGINNPLDSVENSNKDVYNSDTHLLYNNDTNELEVFWRRVENCKMIIYTKKSKDGIHWTNKEIFLFSNNRTIQDYLSPSINYEDGIYKIWYVFRGNIHYTEKKKEKLIKSRILDIKYINHSFSTWHFDIILNKEKKLYEIVSCAYNKKIIKRVMPLFYTKSKDNVIWDTPIKIMEPSLEKSRFDSQGLYRSSLIFENKTYYLFYSGHDRFYNTGIGLRYGSSINQLKPFIINNNFNNI